MMSLSLCEQKIHCEKIDENLCDEILRAYDVLGVRNHNLMADNIYCLTSFMIEGQKILSKQILATVDLIELTNKVDIRVHIFFTRKRPLQELS